MNNYYSFYRPILTNKNFKDLNPVDCGWADCHPCCSNLALRNHYVIHYIMQGSGNVTVSDTTVTVKKGEIFFIKPQTPVQYIASKENPWKYIWISFDGELSKKFSEIKEISMPFDKNIFFEIKKCDLYMSLKEEYLVSKLFELYTEFFSRKEKYNTVYAAANYIDRSYSEISGIEQLAHDLKTDRHHLSRIFKKEIGVTMQEYLIDKRLHEGKKLLRAGFNVSEASEAVGYKDPFVFSKAFKKKYGITPKSIKGGK